MVGVQRRPIGLDPRQYHQAAGEARGRQIRVAFVIFRDGWNTCRKFNPRLFGSSEYVYIWWQMIWRVKRANANELDDRTGTRVVAPYRDSALWAARDLLPFPTVRGRI